MNLIENIIDKQQKIDCTTKTILSTFQKIKIDTNEISKHIAKQTTQNSLFVDIFESLIKTLQKSAHEQCSEFKPRFELRAFA